MREASADILVQSFLREAIVDNFGMGRGIHCYYNIFSADHNVVRPPRCPEGRFWRGCRVTRPDHASSDDSCQKRFLWAHKEVDLVPHPVVGLVLQVGYAEIKTK